MQATRARQLPAVQARTTAWFDATALSNTSDVPLLTGLGDHSLVRFESCFEDLRVFLQLLVLAGEARNLGRQVWLL